MDDENAARDNRMGEFVLHYVDLRTGKPSSARATEEGLAKVLQKIKKKGTKLESIFACGEYGEDPRYTRRPHYHAIIFGISKAEADAVIPSVWGLGQVENGYAEEDSIRYVAGYIDKKWMSGDEKSVEFGGWFPLPDVLPRYWKEMVI